MPSMQRAGSAKVDLPRRGRRWLRRRPEPNGGRSWPRRAILAVAIALSFASGCDSSNYGGGVCARPESTEPTPYTQGTVENGVYMSADWYGELLHFPGGAYYQIHHQLGEVPRWFDFYLSFEHDGLNSGGLAQAAGNQVEVKAIDEQTITIVNSSCATYWILVAVGTGANHP